MESNYKLTIAVITMNRRDQLLEALESCVKCNLPQTTEFVIVDNASTDHTAEAVAAFMQTHPECNICFDRSEVNLGVGGGRSHAFSLAKGEYVYFLDDDAVIAEECQNTFFTDTLHYLDKNRNVASLTTRIYDEMWQADRECDLSSKTKIDGLPIVFKFLGGSHFLRRACFDSPLYFDIQYGSEEYAPSIKVQGRGFYNVFDDHIHIVHKPKVNKWAKGTQIKTDIDSRGIAVQYATKYVLYPAVFRPILWAGYIRRCQKHLKGHPDARKNAAAMAKEIIRKHKTKKISVGNVLKLAKEFGLTTL